MLAGWIDVTRRGRFLLEGALVWLLMPIAAIANGALRDLLLAPLLASAPLRSSRWRSC
jgi:hypothetical protein